MIIYPIIADVVAAVLSIGRVVSARAPDTAPRRAFLKFAGQQRRAMFNILIAHCSGNFGLCLLSWRDYLDDLTSSSRLLCYHLGSTHRGGH
ncbi:MAG TPA: hypothetical protein VHZ03_44230 [Trebonia sp.]|jgi:hypothetical protein|nr:hypothetical protein [Trebonia sp.]